MRYLLAVLLSAALGVALQTLAPSRVRHAATPADTAALAPGVAAASRDTTPRERGLIELRRAQELADDDRLSDALAAYDRAAELLPQIEDWIDLHAASAAAQAGDTVIVEERLTAAGARIAGEFGWDTRLRAFENAGAIDRAIAHAAEIAAASRGGRRAAAWTTAGRLRLQQADTAGARTAFRNAVSASETAFDAARLLTDLPGLTLDDQLDIGRIYLRGGNMERASRGILAYLEAGRGTEAERFRLRFDLGRGFFRAGDYVAAERALRTVAENASASLAAPALYDAARAEYRRGDVTDARATLRTVGQRFPGSGTAARAWYLLADLDQDALEFDAARANFNRAIDTGADSDEVGLSYMRLAGMAFVEERYAAARDAFESYRSRYPGGRRIQQATYWSGVAHLALGDSATAHERFAAALRHDPMNYYGIQASERLDASFTEALDLAVAPVATALPDAAATALDRVDLLRDAGWADAAAFEMDRARASFGSDEAGKYALAEVLNERGYTTQGISLGWSIRRGGEPWNERLLRIIYPFPYREIIITEARKHDIDPFLAAGLIRQESMFNARAVSPAGALGLMQVMPQTGTSLARRLAMPSFAPDMLHDPAVNVALGMQFLADMLREYDGRVDAVLAAYNAGPTRVDRWKEFREWDDPELFSERIPFEETRDYVKIVQQNARLYEALYGDSPAF